MMTLALYGHGMHGLQLRRQCVCAIMLCFLLWMHSKNRIELYGSVAVASCTLCFASSLFNVFFSLYGLEKNSTSSSAAFSTSSKNSRQWSTMVSKVIQARALDGSWDEKYDVRRCHVWRYGTKIHGTKIISESNSRPMLLIRAN